jgi:hypothetical protein
MYAELTGAFFTILYLSFFGYGASQYVNKDWTNEV